MAYLHPHLFDELHFSPPPLILEHEPGKYRLIHNLFYARDNSVNTAIPKEPSGKQ